MMIMKISLNPNEFEHNIVDMIEDNGYALVGVIKNKVDIRYKYIHTIYANFRITVGNKTITFYIYDGNNAIEHKTFKLKNLNFIEEYLKNIRYD